MRAEKPTVEEVLRLNPQIDPTEIESVQELLRQYRNGGPLRTARRNLASPLERRKATMKQQRDDDSRRINLSRR
jgi:hypothetical protein